MFREVQHLGMWPVKAVVGAATALICWGFYQQILLGRPWGSRPAPDWVLFAILAFVVFLFTSLFRSKLITEVRPAELYLRYDILCFPFRKHIDIAHIRSAEARTYQPLSDYLGWGIRYGTEGKCWTVRGNRGVFLRFDNGERLLVGSQESDALAAAILTRMPAHGTGA